MVLFFDRKNDGKPTDLEVYKGQPSKIGYHIRWGYVYIYIYKPSLIIPSFAQLLVYPLFMQSMIGNTSHVWDYLKQTSIRVFLLGINYGSLTSSWGYKPL